MFNSVFCGIKYYVINLGFKHTIIKYVYWD